MKLSVGVVFGGISAEHEISLQSAKNVIKAMDPERYEVAPVLIDRDGNWFLVEISDLDYTDHSFSHDEGRRIIVAPDNGRAILIGLRDGRPKKVVDIFFPLLHGPYGEDGSFQGFCRLYQIPFVGAGVLGSAIGMDKDITKRLLRERGIPVPRFEVYTRKARNSVISYHDISNRIGFPLFVKPSNLGSSVGISKVNTVEELQKAMNLAWEYDFKIIIEEYIDGREIECSVLGNLNPVASLPGEIITRDEFYSYTAKYEDDNGAILKIPAELPEETIKRVQELSIKAFQILCCEGMARVDFFLRRDGSLFVNELNSIPGFTNISMYPKLWEISGISYPELIDRLIELGLERYHMEMQLDRYRHP